MNRTSLSVIALAVGAVLIIALYNVYKPAVNNTAHDVFDKVRIGRMEAGNEASNPNHHANPTPTDPQDLPVRFGVSSRQWKKGIKVRTYNWNDQNDPKVENDNPNIKPNYKWQENQMSTGLNGVHDMTLFNLAEWTDSSIPLGANNVKHHYDVSTNTLKFYWKSDWGLTVPWDNNPAWAQNAPQDKY